MIIIGHNYRGKLDSFGDFKFRKLSSTFTTLFDKIIHGLK